MLVVSVILLLLSNAVNLKRESSILYSRISVLILINTIILFIINFDVNFLLKGIILYGGLMSIKLYSYVFISFILLLSAFILGITSVIPHYFENKVVHPNYWSFPDIKNYIYDNNFNLIKKFWISCKIIFYSLAIAYVKFFFIENFFKKISQEFSSGSIASNKMGDQFRIIEYPLIILFCITGAVFLISSSDIISIFLSLELQSYGLYLISSIYRNSESSINAGLTYFLLGGLSSCIILLGLSLLYINTGNTSLENIYIINSIFNDFISNILNQNISIDNLWVYKHILVQYTYMQLPIAIISIGLLFKISSAPFHFWSPDVYDAIPTIVTTFVAIIAKISILILFIQLIFYTENNIISYSWSNTIILSSVLSLLIGSILGLVQFRIKRLYAYSTISHLGFILLALSINNLEASRAFFFYILQYSISNLNLFIILISIGYSLYLYINNDYIKLKNDKYSPIQYISQLKGFYFINPILSLSFIITLFSFVGVPPLIGFFGKQMVLSAALNSGYIFTSLIAIITSVISAVYYLVLVKLIFFENNNYILNSKLFSYFTDSLEKIKNKHLKLKKKEITFFISTQFIEDLIPLFKVEKNNIIISGYLSFTIAFFTLFILSFVLFDQELIKLIYIMI